MKIYTKTGDKGNTSLIGGERVPKHHPRIEAYGSVDELNSYTGLLLDLVSNEVQSSVLTLIQDRLFILGSLLAAAPGITNMKLPELKEIDITLLEKEIDRMNADLPELHNFILPGGHRTVSFCHIARSICRRTERLTVRLNEESPVNPLLIKYLNRLSDYFFVLSRAISQELHVKERIWKPLI